MGELLLLLRVAPRALWVLAWFKFGDVIGLFCQRLEAVPEKEVSLVANLEYMHRLCIEFNAGLTARLVRTHP